MGTKKMGSFLVWTPKNGGHSVCKQFQAKICKFYVEIAVKLLISQNASEACKNVQFVCKI